MSSHMRQYCAVEVSGKSCSVGGLRVRVDEVDVVDGHAAIIVRPLRG